ncbi:hypothetical protein ACFQY8_02390 [Alloscardovia venturai]|uniref:Fungal lipase-type domain-containing protein n=2 Tax=Alloscardovia venturai TaxID=1769421 RepID=A0ABW2Y551_9BIFI
MSFTPQQLNALAGDVYSLKDGRYASLTKSYPLNDKNQRLGYFHTLDYCSNSSNGFQAMAVAPLGENPPKHVAVVYAGTYPLDMADIHTDMQLIISGDSSELKRFCYDSANPKTGVATTGNPAPEIGIEEYPNQLDQARTFAQKILKKYPHASYQFTGHSLGGFLAINVGAENHKPSVGWNAPAPGRVMSESIKRWIKSHSKDYQNYRTNNDIIGNFDAFNSSYDLGITHWSGNARKSPSFLKNHGLDQYDFDNEGYVRELGSLYDKAFANLSVLRSYLSDADSQKRGSRVGKLSDTDGLVFDSVQSEAVATNLCHISESSSEEINTLTQKLSRDLEELYRNAYRYPPRFLKSLSSDEIYDLLAAVGVTHHSMVDIVGTEAAENLRTVRDVNSAMEKLHHDVKVAAEKLLQKDVELARLLTPAMALTSNDTK